MAYQLYDYQQRLVDRTREAYREGYTAPCVVAPCGAGKSVIIAEIIRMTTANRNHVLFLVHRRELIDQIRKTLEGNDVDMDYVELGMVQTVVRRLKKTTRPSLIVVDENHHVLANSYKKILAHFNTKVVGFTATPVRLNGSGLGDINDILIEEVDATWLIEHKRLAPYRYYAPKLIDDTQLKKSSTREYTKQSVDNAMGVTIFGDVIKHYRTLANNKSGIAYCHSVEASINLSNTLNDAGIVSAHLDGTTPAGERDAIIQGFRDGDITILTNVDIIGEGFDVPDCEVVLLLRPTASLSLHIQQSMRAMRYKAGKTAIIIDHVGNAMRHGLPDTERRWELKGKQTDTGDGVKARQCENCFAVYHANESECPLCGYSPPITEREPVVTVTDDDLTELTKADFELTIDHREPSECRNMSELYQLAKNRGYKRGWAYHQGKLLGYIR